MRPLNASELLEVWEWGITQPALVRMLYLLAYALETENIEQISRMSIGERDWHLLQLRKYMFGQNLSCSIECPECRKTIEWQSNVDALCSVVDQSHQNRQFLLSKDGFEITYRLPSSKDIIKLSSDDDSGNVSENLIQSCVLEVTKKKKKVHSHDLPQHLLEELEKCMEKLDPLADIQILLNCPYCHHQWQEMFDILTFFWQEIDLWTKRLLQEISILALHYGWSEKEIVELSPLRRQFYLNSI